MWRSLQVLIAVAAAAVGVIIANLQYYHTVPPCADAGVAALAKRFRAQVNSGAEPPPGLTAEQLTDGLSIYSTGVLKRDRDTFFWSLFTDKFGSNPNTPYMWLAFPLLGFLLPSPMWRLGAHDAIVLLSRVPPATTYFSFTSFALFMPRRGLPFSSLGDSVNNLNIRADEHGLFAHVLTANGRTYSLVEEALVESGLPTAAINLAAVPSDVGLFDDWTFFEVVLRLFRFADQRAGDAYLAAAHPAFHLTTRHGKDEPLVAFYKNRTHGESVSEGALAANFEAHGAALLANVGRAFHRDLSAAPPPIAFTPLRIHGLECLEKGTECLGDCPDAAYYGPHVLPDSDRVEMLSLGSDDTLHLVSLVDHQKLGAATYGSVALLVPAPAHAAALSKTRMSIRATSIGVTSFDLPAERENPFWTWAFTRNPSHCARLAGAVDGCTLVTDAEVQRGSFLTYCERIYLNPVTATGPDWADLLPARLHHIDLAAAPLGPLSDFDFPPLPTGLPPSMPLAKFDGTEGLRFLHIIKTGGESLEKHLASEAVPRLDFSTCRSAAWYTWRNSTGGTATTACVAAAAGVSAALCGLNCECCAADVRVPSGGGFHGTLLRSPRAHALSLFSHGHVAHHTSMRRAASDVPLWLAERILRATEVACGSNNFGTSADWKAALRESLQEDAAEEARPLRVLPIDNTQAHALTCSKARKGSLGHHFRNFAAGDALAPPLDEAIAALRRFEWVGLTDLFEPSLCLLHYQANGTLPPTCDCRAPEREVAGGRLGAWTETRSTRRDPDSLDADVLARIDARTAVDGALFAAALRLLLARLRRVEEETGAVLLRCIDWEDLHRRTGYIDGLWAGGPTALVPDSWVQWVIGY